MLAAFGYLDGSLAMRQLIEDLPRQGETVQFRDGRTGVVTRIIWRYDEEHANGQRVDILATQKQARHA